MYRAENTIATGTKSTSHHRDFGSKPLFLTRRASQAEIKVGRNESQPTTINPAYVLGRRSGQKRNATTRREIK
jgi:hypothetical protein